LADVPYDRIDAATRRRKEAIRRRRLRHRRHLGHDRRRICGAITRRYPQLRVVTIGDPDWVTPEKYSEIVNDWIKPNERFDIDHPTGWLARWDDRLSAPREPSS
jgi:hypothetical protein